MMIVDSGLLFWGPPCISHSHAYYDEGLYRKSVHACS